jgi:hypothetical protein
VGKPDV